MRTYVLLTDDDNNSLLVQCEDHATAERVAAAGVWSDGGVSAWLVPNEAVPSTEADKVADLLRDGENCYGVAEQIAERVHVGVVAGS